MTTYRGVKTPSKALKCVQAILGLIAGTLFWWGLFSIPSINQMLGR